MTPLTPYHPNKITLSELMAFISTDEFIELPAPERQKYLQRLTELVKIALT